MAWGHILTRVVFVAAFGGGSIVGQPELCRLSMLAAQARPQAHAPSRQTSAVAAPSWATAMAPLVLRGVTVIDVREGRRVPDQTVVVAGNRIQALGPTGTVPVPKGAHLVEAHGKYLIPGLWDLHVHPQHFVDIAYPLFLANGVTGVRDAGSEVPLATLGQWKREIAVGTRVGPRLIVSGPSLDGAAGSHDPTKVIVDSSNNINRFFHLQVPAADARRVVDSLHAAGADMLKFYDLPYAERVVMAAEARRLGIPFGGHSAEMDGTEFSDSGATILDHGTWTGVCGEANHINPPPFDAAQCAAAMQRLRHNNTWVAAMSMFGSMTAGGEGFYAHLVSVARRYVPASLPGNPRTWPVAGADTMAPEPASTVAWQGIVSLRTQDDSLQQVHLARLRTAGVPLVVGTDAGFGMHPLIVLVLPGFMVRYTLLSFVLFGGLTPLEALQTATLNPALALRASDSLGTVEVGKLADLVLLDADPLADIWNVIQIRAVVANGRYYDRAALDRLLVQAEQAAARQ